MDEPITFYSFPVSHYAEKVRWAMDLCDISYNEVDHWVPVLHWPRAFWLARARTVPFIKTEQGVVHDSTNVLNWLSENRKFHIVPQSAKERSEAMAIEELADSIGFDIIRYMYITLLEHPDDFVEVWAWKAKPLERKVLKNMLPAFKRMMSYSIGFSKEDEVEGEKRLMNVFSIIDEKLSDGREFLIGDQLTIADISVASILAPILTPPEHALYSSKYFQSHLAEKNRRYEGYASYQWMRELYRNYRHTK